MLSTTLSQFNARTFTYNGQDWQDFISRVKVGNPDLGGKAETRAGAELQRIASGSFDKALASINLALTTTAVVSTLPPLTSPISIMVATVVPSFTPTNVTNPSGFYTIPTAAYTAFVLGNADKADHIRLLGDNTFGFEDLANGGDKDYNDIIVKVNLV